LKRRAWRRFGAVCALAGLAIRLLIAAVHVPPAVAGVAPGAAAFLSQIVLCTASGLRIVQLDKDGKPIEPGKSRPPQSCPICTALSGAPLALAPSAAVLPAPKWVAAFAPERRAALVIGHKPLVVRGRDPPFQA